MKRSWILGAVVAAYGCHMPNPAFDERDLAEDTVADDIGDGDGDPGDGDTGDGDGDTGDGDGDSGDGDGDGDTADTTTDTGETDTGEECPPGEPDMCADVCTNVDEDPQNCGDCGVPCALDQDCMAGKCERPRVMFVTAFGYAGDLGGLLGADFICASHAAGYFPQDKNFLAWNSTAMSFPNNSIPQDGYFIRTDQALIAGSWQDLTDGELHVPIDLDESGAVIDGEDPCLLSSQAWTGTTPGGGFYQGPNCANWTLAGESYNGTIGNIHATDATWTLSFNNCNEPQRCSQERRIYCIEY